jgi:hypothetical protein
MEYHVPKLTRTEIASEEINQDLADENTEIFMNLVKSLKKERQDEIYGKQN